MIYFNSMPFWGLGKQSWNRPLFPLYVFIPALVERRVWVRGRQQIRKTKAPGAGFCAEFIYWCTARAFFKGVRVYHALWPALAVDSRVWCHP